MRIIFPAPHEPILIIRPTYPHSHEQCRSLNLLAGISSGQRGQGPALAKSETAVAVLCGLGVCRKSVELNRAVWLDWTPGARGHL
jgi:hypothetical protein